jgi:putative DNA primase/helicase
MTTNSDGRNASNVATTQKTSNGTGDHVTSNVVDLQVLSDLVAQMVAGARVEPLAHNNSSSSSSDLAQYLRTAGTDDEANAQCVVRLWPDRFAHNAALGWLAYDGRKWSPNADSDLDRAVVEMLRKRVNAASDQGFDSVRKFCAQNSGRLDGCKRLLSSLVHTLPDVIDAKPDLLNCPNGVIDLRTGELRPSSPDDLLTHCVAVPFDPAADRSIWCNWLAETVDKETADYLELAVGYSLTGRTNEEALFYVYGPPRSGKGVFLETILSLLGRPIAQEVMFSTFTARRDGDSQNFDLAPLKSCRFIAASESNSYERFNEAKVKSITGGSEVYCAHKHKDFFGYRPQYKIWLSSNEPVNADPDDDAVWSRIRVIEFPNSRLGSEDKTLKTRLRTPEALAGLLSWAVEGAVRWYRLAPHGLPELSSSAAIKAEHRELVDNIGAWLAENTVKAEFSTVSTLYSDYTAWCTSNGVTPKQQKAFTLALRRKGYAYDVRKLSGKTVRGFSGLAVAVIR